MSRRKPSASAHAAVVSGDSLRSGESPAPERGERGSMAIDPSGAHATLTFRRTYAHPPARVWDAIATPDGLAGWLFAKHVTLEARVGGAIAMTSGPTGYRSTGRVLAWDPPHAFAYEWNVAPVAEMPHGERASFHYTLAARADGGTNLMVVVRRISTPTARGFLPGVHAFLDRLAAQLADPGTPLPDWFACFAAARTAYPEWSDGA